jgi:integrase
MDKPEPDVVDWFSEEEQVLILDKIPKHDQAIFDFMFLTGVRVNEGVGLQRKDTQWDRRVTIIRHTVKRDGSLGIVKNKKKRIIPHFPGLTECLKKAQKVAGFHDYQFVNRWGRRYSMTT